MHTNKSIFCSFTVFVVLVTFPTMTIAKEKKFKSGDCLYFEADEKAESTASGAIWKINGITKENKYIVRVFGGKNMLMAKRDTFTTSGWAKNLQTLSVQNTDNDGTKVDCPKE